MNGPITLIGLAGGGHVGKNTIGDRLMIQHGFWAMAFAEPLYDGLVATLGLADEALDPERKEQPIPGLGRSLRELLQGYGDFLRTTCGADILIRRIEEDMRQANIHGHDNFVITDVRLVEEVTWIREQGGVIWWVSRPDAPAVRAHLTESIMALHDLTAKPEDTYLRNDGTWGELVAKVDVQLEALRAREFAAP